MDNITATELQMLECFGVEPKFLDPNEPWCYNDAAYSVELDGFSVSFAVQPAYRDVRIIVRRGEQRLYELNALGLADVLGLDEPGRDMVEVRFSERKWSRLQLRHALEITEGFDVRQA